jgi:hypothetical protein
MNGSSNNGNSSPTQNQSAQLSSPIAGTYKSSSVTLQYGVAVSLAPGQNFLGQTNDAGHAFAIVLSDEAIGCDTNFSFALATGHLFAFKFQDANEGSAPDVFRYLVYTNDGYLNSGGDAGTVVTGSIDSNVAGVVHATVSYSFYDSSAQAITTSIGGAVVVPYCAH